MTLVEQAFRTCKTAHLETRPVYVRTAEHTRGHVLVAMPAYLIRRELSRAWASLDVTMGMIVTKEDHDQFHGAAPALTPKQHNVLMKRMGITREQDEEWHRTHLTLAQQRAKGLKHIDPFALGAGFLAWCVKQGWLVQQDREYFASKDGVRELRERFDISA